MEKERESDIKDCSAYGQKYNATLTLSTLLFAVLLFCLSSIIKNPKVELHLYMTVDSYKKNTHMHI